MPRLRTLSATAALVGVGAAGAGCGAHDDTIPFRRITPRAAEQPIVPRDAAPCAAPVARLLDAGRQGLNAAFSLSYVEVRNRGNRTCVIAGPPAVTVPGPQTIPMSVSFTSRPYGRALPWRVAVEPGAAAETMLLVSHLCADPLRQRTTVHYRVSLDGFAGVNQNALGCATGTSIQASPFQPDIRPRKGSRWPLRARLIVPRRAAGGKTLRFTVELTNVSSKTFRFPYCPDYSMDGESWALNCAAVGAMSPGSARRFAMELMLARAGSRSTYALDWFLEPDQGRSVGARATIRLR